jgi:hypothetical protein
MTRKIEVRRNTPIVFADYDDYTGTASGYVRTNQIDLTSLANNAARQGDKQDMSGLRDTDWIVMVAIEFDVAPASGAEVKFYWANSPHGTAENANPGGCSGNDSAYNGTGGDSIEDSLEQLDFIGALVCTNDAATTVQYQKIGIIKGAEIERYGIPVVLNKSGQAFEGDAVEMYIALVPMTNEIQDEVL